jgi:hypothetical protein
MRKAGAQEIPDGQEEMRPIVDPSGVAPAKARSARGLDRSHARRAPSCAPLWGIGCASPGWRSGMVGNVRSPRSAMPLALEPSATRSAPSGPSGADRERHSLSSTSFRVRALHSSKLAVADGALPQQPGSPAITASTTNPLPQCCLSATVPDPVSLHPCTAGTRGSSLHLPASCPRGAPFRVSARTRSVHPASTVVAAPTPTGFPAATEPPSMAARGKQSSPAVRPLGVPRRGKDAPRVACWPKRGCEQRECPPGFGTRAREDAEMRRPSPSWLHSSKPAVDDGALPQQPACAPKGYGVPRRGDSPAITASTTNSPPAVPRMGYRCCLSATGNGPPWSHRSTPGVRDSSLYLSACTRSVHPHSSLPTRASRTPHASHAPRASTEGLSRTRPRRGRVHPQPFTAHAKRASTHVLSRTRPALPSCAPLCPREVPAQCPAWGEGGSAPVLPYVPQRGIRVHGVFTKCPEWGMGYLRSAPNGVWGIRVQGGRVHAHPASRRAPRASTDRLSRTRPLRGRVLSHLFSPHAERAPNPPARSYLAGAAALPPRPVSDLHCRVPSCEVPREVPACAPLWGAGGMGCAPLWGIGCTQCEPASPLPAPRTPLTAHAPKKNG